MVCKYVSNCDINKEYYIIEEMILFLIMIDKLRRKEVI